VVRGKGAAVVERRVEEVFDYLADVSNHVDWQSNELFVDPLTPLPLGVGSQFLEVRQTLGRRYESVVEVVAYEPPAHLMYRVVEGPVPYEIAYALTGSGADTTRIEMVVTGDAGGYLGVRESILQAVAEREIAGALGNMKDILESTFDDA
jgi:Polyketide cyclase / dehydrase and lipid transport